MISQHAMLGGTYLIFAFCTFHVLVMKYSPWGIGQWVQTILLAAIWPYIILLGIFGRIIR